MPATIISDTSCLILLEKLGKLYLLNELFGEIITTQVVADEFGKQLPEWIKIKTLNDTKSFLILTTTLDKGEASAIALALDHEECLLIIDEFRGRKIAKQLGITITGTLGVLAKAKQVGLINELRPLLEKVKQTDFRLSEELVLEVLKQVGE